MRGIAPLMLFGMLLLAGAATANDNIVEPSQAVPLFLKIITYDENFDTDRFDRVRVCVVFDRKTPRSYSQYLRIKDFLASSGTLAVKGLGVDFEGTSIKDIDEVIAGASDRAYNIFLVTSIGDEMVAALLGKSNVSRFRSCTLESRYVPLGIAVGISLERDKNHAIQVNMAATAREGSKLSAHLLKMCTVWEK